MSDLSNEGGHRIRKTVSVCALEPGAVGLETVTSLNDPVSHCVIS